MSRFVRLGHYLLNAELVTYVHHFYDPHREQSLIRIGFSSAAELEVPAKALGVEETSAEVRDAVLEHVLDALRADAR